MISLGTNVICSSISDGKNVNVPLPAHISSLKRRFATTSSVMDRGRYATKRARIGLCEIAWTPGGGTDVRKCHVQ